MQEMTPEILSAKNLQDAKRWTELVENSAFPDVFYLPEYACATAEVERTEPMALIAGPSSDRILAPILVRRMSATVNDSKAEWLDAATPYGFGGLLRLSTSVRADPSALEPFFEQLDDWCRSLGIVCCVIRLHPLIDQQKWFVPNLDGKNVPQLHSRKFTWSIDCNDWDEESDLPKYMNHGRHEDIRLANRSLRVTWTSGEDHNIETSLSIFSSLYNEMLDNRASDSFYRFPPSYFSGLAKLGRRMGVVVAWHEDEPVGANVALSGTQYAYGHLAVTNRSGRKSGASTLLNIEQARWARRQGCRLLHLGGGMRPGDGMEEYKKSYHGPSHSYRWLTYVVDHKRFEQICRLPNAPWPYNLPVLYNHPDDRT
jgi:hypothetical protein